MSKTMNYVAFLRGINVGGTNLVSMADLQATFAGRGFTGVRTFLNTGNILFQSDAADSRKLEAVIEAAIASHFTKPIRVMVRSSQEMADLVAHLPKSWQDPSDKRCNVIFLSHTIDAPSLVEQFHPKPGIEELHYVPGALLWSASLAVLTKSTMLKLAVSPLYEDMTIRRLSSVMKINELLQSESKNITY
jgi:uncharacterized protein (DUF1697 family)